LCIVQMLMYTWLRVSELANLKVKDIWKELQIIGKWWKRRVVFLYPEDLKLIDLYLFLRKRYKSDWLFISLSSNANWNHLSRVSIEKIIREWAKEAGIEWKVFPHKLRHTFATNLLRAKVDISHIQGLLWHENIATTQTYLTVLNKDLERAQRLAKRY
jgi:site-specific recombinase XerD